MTSQTQAGAEFGFFELCGPSHHKSRRVSETRNSAIPAEVASDVPQKPEHRAKENRGR
jgi:hypothetical protein